MTCSPFPKGPIFLQKNLVRSSELAHPCIFFFIERLGGKEGTYDGFVDFAPFGTHVCFHKPKNEACIQTKNFTFGLFCES